MMKRRIAAGMNCAWFRSRDPGKISRRLAYSSCYYPERFRLIYRGGPGHLSLLRTRLPCKAYHGWVSVLIASN
jgi:hypothetical protein